MGPDGGNGYGEQASVDVDEIDAAAVGREAAEKARASANPVAVDPGDWTVVLEEPAVVDLLSIARLHGLQRAGGPGGALVRRARQGDRERARHDRRRRARSPARCRWRSTTRASPSRGSSSSSAGVCRDVVYDAQTAARDGVASTGHGLPAPNSYGPFPLNMVMSAGTTDREALVGEMERGLLVTRFHYTNPVHPKLAIVTGMTRDGTFLVEDGRIVGPVRNLRFTQSYLAALAGTVAVGRERRTLKGDFGGVLVPAVRIDGWTFTGVDRALTGGFGGGARTWGADERPAFTALVPALGSGSFERFAIRLSASPESWPGPEPSAFRPSVRGDAKRSNERSAFRRRITRC